MSVPLAPQLRGIDLAIFDLGDRLDATLSALRRRDRDDALEQLGRWRPTWHRLHDDWSADLTAWVRDECRLHVQDGRFEHAIALIERYRPQPAYMFKEPA